MGISTALDANGREVRGISAMNTSIGIVIPAKAGISTARPNATVRSRPSPE